MDLRRRVSHAHSMEIALTVAAGIWLAALLPLVIIGGLALLGVGLALALLVGVGVYLWEHPSVTLAIVGSGAGLVAMFWSSLWLQRSTSGAVGLFDVLGASFLLAVAIVSVGVTVIDPSVEGRVATGIASVALAVWALHIVRGLWNTARRARGRK
jgi:hypothetical protein